MRALVLTAVVAASVTLGSAPQAARSLTPVDTKTLADGLTVPWGLVLLPDGDVLFTERRTTMVRRIPRGGGQPQPFREIPDVNVRAGEGGLLGLALSPNFAADGLVYAYYTSVEGRDNRVVRFTANGPIEPVITGIQRDGIHNGGRIGFGPDGKLYVSTGEVGQPELAQDLASLNGKILRANPDGSVPTDNPFPGTLVYSYGHRNVQGLAWDRAGRLWATELGLRAADEVNLIQPGRNYGWPLVEGRGSTRNGRLTNPKVVWSPTSTASPSGAVVIGDRLYVAALKGTALFRLRLDGETATKDGRIFRGHFGRLRSVIRAEGSGLLVSTSNDEGTDRIIRIPALAGPAN